LSVGPAGRLRKSPVLEWNRAPGILGLRANGMARFHRRHYPLVTCRGDENPDKLLPRWLSTPCCFQKTPTPIRRPGGGLQSTGIRVEVCEDIFTAIEKGEDAGAFVRDCGLGGPAGGKLPVEACSRVRAEPRDGGHRHRRSRSHAAEMRDNRLDFLIYRPISVEEAEAVLAKACEKMQPSSAKDAAAPGQPMTSSEGPSPAADGETPEHSLQPRPFCRKRPIASEHRRSCGVPNTKNLDRTGAMHARVPRSLRRRARACRGVFPVEIARSHRVSVAHAGGNHTGFAGIGGRAFL
jgi:hypothetical protein